MMTEVVLDAAALGECSNEFDLDIRVIPERGRAPRNWLGDPDPSEPGSTCHFSCARTCGGQCTFQPADPECSAK